MDFRSASDNLDSGIISQEEITRQIVNLPCIYGIFQNQSKIFCLEVKNRQNNQEISVVLLYSNLKLAIEATNAFEIPTSWYIAQWSDIDDSLRACSELEIDAIAFDAIPEHNSLSGLVLDKESLQELIRLSYSTN